jgi:hypothetical protein
MHPLGFVSDSNQLAVSQAHYLPSGEPEVSTQLVDADGSIASVAHSVLGPKYSEISGSSFDFGAGRVWFLCAVYSARVDRQPRCTLPSASLSAVNSIPSEIPPPPDDRVIGSGQTELGFPSSDLAVLLAQDRLWLYSFSARTFRQMNLSEILITSAGANPQADQGLVPTGASQRFRCTSFTTLFSKKAKYFEVPHGTRIVVVDMTTLQIVQTIQPNKEKSLIDLALKRSRKGVACRMGRIAEFSHVAHGRALDPMFHRVTHSRPSSARLSPCRFKRLVLRSRMRSIWRSYYSPLQASCPSAIRVA